MNDTRTVAAKNRVRAAARAMPREFIGLDGEGITVPETGEHKYVLLTCGDHHLAHNGEHLHFLNIIPFLWACFLENPREAYVGFFLSYDWGQWFRTLPVDRAKMLLTVEGQKARERKVKRTGREAPFPVRWEGWEFDYLPGRRFKLRPEGVPPKRTPGKYILPAAPKQGRLKPAWKYMHVCDGGAYFQTSFLKAIDPAGALNPVCTTKEYEIIKQGKDRRKNAAFDPQMVEYNTLECEILSRMMDQLEQGTKAAGLKLKRSEWFGPGQIAQKWLLKIKAPKGEEIREAIPEPIREAARASYYGGWFEQFWHGQHKGASYSYDINSAYPYQMAQLPCLLHGSWEHWERLGGRRMTRSELSAMTADPGVKLIHARLTGVHPLVGAAPHRTPKRRILRPRQTEGWFWAAELAASYKAGFIDQIHVAEIWKYHPCDCPPPLAPIGELYEQRLKAGKNTIQGKTYKLIYNSGYGKFAQSVGNPTFANAVYASLITSGCRIMCIDAIASHPQGARALLMVATDSVTFSAPHPGLALDANRLGAWDGKEHQNLSLFQPGVYWDDEARARIAKGEAPVFKSRGVPARDIAKRIGDIDAAWNRFYSNGWPTLTLPISFQFISPKQALARGKWELCGAVIQAENEHTWAVDKHGNKKAPARVINASPADKRYAEGPGQSYAYETAPGGVIVSTPYEGSFGDELRAFQDEEFGDHPDGPPGDLLAEMVMDN